MIALTLCIALLSQAPASWKEVDQLVKEQKFDAALKATEGRLAAAKAGADEAELARALVRVTQLRISLGSYETAVKALKAEPWPKALLPRATLELYYAATVSRYLSAYSWEIRTREKVESKGEVDLKAWTAEQLFAEAQKSYEAVWAQREALGSQSLGALAEYLTPNDYPKGVRDTLRDAVTYLRADSLRNSAYWSPEASNEIYRLDFAGLLKGDPPGTSKVVLTDTAVHPLVRLGAMYDDLEAWHAKAGRREAALNARMERLETLRAHFTAEDERARVIAELEGRFEGTKDLPWSAMARATAADWVRETGDQVRARAIAQAGLSAFPQSPGGRRCLSIIKAIEAPDYSLGGMEADGIERRSLEVSARNVGKLYFRAYRVDVASLFTSTSYSVLPQDDEIRRVMASAAPVAKWTVTLAPTPDFAMHRTPVVPPLKEQGLFVVVTSVREDFVDSANRLMAANLLITRLVMSVRELPQEGAIEAQVVDGETGEVQAGVDVELWGFEYGRPRNRVETQKTGPDGAVRFTPKNRQGKNHFMVAHRASDWAIEKRPFYLSSSTRYEVNSALIYTDRSVYRPQQKVQWKVVAYKGSADRSSYAVVPNAEVAVSLMDANHQSVETRTVKTNAFGSASGEFLIPSGRLLGQWSLTTRGGSAFVRVEEYKRPTFEVAFKDTGAALKLNAPATLTGEAKYYFGLPVSSGQVKWRVTRSPQWPWWWYEWGWLPGTARAQVVASGTAAVKADGTFEVKFTPAADPRLSKDVTYRYEVGADFTDEGGETRSASRAVRLGAVAVEARALIEGGFVREGAEASVAVKRTDLDGNGRAGKGSWQLLAITRPEKALLPADEPLAAGRPGDPAPGYRSEGDALRSRWSPGYSWTATLRRWGDGAEKARGELTHDAKGEASLALPKLPPGAWRLKYQTKDEFGGSAVSQLDFVVAGQRLELELPAVFAAEATTVPVGGTARFLVSSYFKNQTLVMDVFRDSRRVDRRLVRAGRDGAVVELPVKEDDRGGFSVVIQAVRDFQLMSFATNVFVPRDDKELKVEFATLRDTLRPGAKETFRVTVRGKGQKLEAGAAEVLAYMYDQSLDIFAPHTPPSVLGLYPTRAGWPSQMLSLGSSDVQYLSRNNWYTLPSAPSLRDDALKFFEEYGIGGPGSRGGYGGGSRALRMRASSEEGESIAEKKGMLRDEPSPAPPAPARAAAGLLSKEEAKKVVMSPAEPSQEAAGAQVQVRSNFSETAFFKPNLVPDASGAVSFDFTVPDSVTAWNVWAHAVTRDLRGGSVKATTRSVKDLMVRPYLPRFLREGDEAAIKVVVNNASTRDLSGELRFEIFDPVTNVSLADEFQLANKAPQAFSAKAGQGATLTFPLKAPKRVGQVAFRVIGKTGDFSDGELRPMPLLPSRLHLAQSRFVTLRDKDERAMTFEDLKKNDDPTRINEQLVVTVDAQLFFTVLQALPYLVRYPYECTEQTLNRFLSTGIVSSVFRDHPAVAKMAQGFAKRQTPLETFDGFDPNRKLTLEESPWLIEAKGGKDPLASDEFINMLDPKVIAAERASALTRLKKAQLPNGAFPWWVGGPPSGWMTLYLMHGFAKASEFKVEVPREMVQRAWAYLASDYRTSYQSCMAHDGCWEYVTFLNYVASAYPDESWTAGALTADERTAMLDFSFKHWKQHSPYLKGYLALTLKRAGRAADARLVFDSVMDSAKTTRDEGTFWQPEDRSWLWYNDTIETHAFALRALTELQPKDARRDGLVQWLLINKKLNQWKSTRATAEVIYSLVKYMEAEKTLGIREESNVQVGPITKKWVFEPDEYTGKKNQLVIPGEQIDAKTMSTVKVSKATKGFQFASATWHFSTETLPAEARGDLFQVSRTYFKREKGPTQTVLKPLAEGAKLHPGDEIEVQLSLKAKAAAEYVHLRDPRGAGFEPEGAVSRYKYNLGLGWYEEYRDSGTNFFFEQLPAGEFTFKYRLRANLGGTFRVGPATVQSMYAPEFTAYSQGHSLTIATGGQ